MNLVRLTLLLFTCTLLRAQSDPVVQSVTRYRHLHESEIVAKFIDLLKIPNVAADPSNLRRNALAIKSEFDRRGVKAKLLEQSGVPPVVYGELLSPGATRTVLFYVHYDGSPLNAKQWATPPFDPVLRSGPLDKGGQIIPVPQPGQALDPEWRIYARSASDDKAPIIGLLTALDALRSNGQAPSSNVKFLIEGEEETGSRHLEQIIADHKDLLKADVWLICDGPIHQSGLQQIDFGARGVVTATLTVYGARRELHSGHYGNWAPNPAMMLAQLLASMKDEQGHVWIEHFYDGVEPLSPDEKQAIAEMPNFDEELKKEVWLGRTEGAGHKLAELITLPSLNVRGFSSGRTDSASNVIPSTATAAIDMRLVPGISHEKAIARLKAHIAKQGYFIADRAPDPNTLITHPKVLFFQGDEFAYDAVRTPMDLPISKAVLKAVSRARNPIIKLPTMGGSLPLIMIETQLAAHTIIVPIANFDNNQHSHNENIRLQNLWDGINVMAALLMQ